jgi:RNA polymerase sigma factor (sigma-70 family)
LTDNEQHAKFATVVTPHLTDAYTLARWLTRSQADADDVLQEACIRAFGAIDQRSGQNPRAWLMAIVRNAAYTWINGRRSAMLVRIDDLSERDRIRVESGGDGADGPIDPESGMIARADVKQIEALISDLPLEFRETLVLRDLQGFGYREIAEVTGVPVGTVMSRLARARQRVIAAIKEGNS